MKKTVIMLFMVANLYAISYEELLELAIQNNTQLQITQSQEEKVNIQGQIETRLENPSLELEVSDFSAKRVLRGNQFGSRVGVSQSLLLPSVKEDKKALTQKRVELNRQNFQLEKSEFVYEFDLKYLAYKEAKAKELLQQEAINISQEILDVVTERFNAGSIAKSELIQAQIEKMKSEKELKTLELERLKKRNSLLLFANLDATFQIDDNHLFMQKNSTAMHPLLKLTQKKEELARAKLAVASHNIEKIELFSEIEAEPDQDVFRVGFSIPLPIFNQKSQEKQLAKIEMNNQQMALNFQKKALGLEIEQLQNEIAMQGELEQSQQVIIQEQNQLLSMYQQGYAIAKVNLLRLNTVKRELLSSKNKRLEAKFAIEKNNIKINYLQGAYND